MRLFLAAGLAILTANLMILGGHVVLRRSMPAPTVAIPVKNFHMVDDRIWRGAAPSKEALAELAESGVTTIVDLRAEKGIEVDEAYLRDLGLVRHHLPIRDGQAPPPHTVTRFLEIVAESPGAVFVHCGAGVGRTGTVVAAYLVATGTPARAALAHNLGVGPPSLEQVAFAAKLEAGKVDRPGPLVVGVSRLIDGPRRTWVHVRGSYTRH